MNIFLPVFTQVVILFMLIGVGIAIKRKGIVNNDGVKQLTNLLLLVVMPCLILNSFITMEFTSEVYRNMLLTVTMTVASLSVFILISSILFRGKSEKQAVYRFSATYGNFGFMGIPLAGALLGSEAVLYASIVVAVANFFFFTHGIALYQKDFKLDKKSLLKILLHPCLIALAIGVGILLLQVQVPEVISSPVAYIASMNSALSMIIIGCTLANKNFLKVLSNKDLIFPTLLRLLVFPLLVVFVCSALGITGLLPVATTVLQLTCPVAGSAVFFAQMYDGDVETSSDIVAYSAFFSIITMPLIMTIYFML